MEPHVQIVLIVCITIVILAGSIMALGMKIQQTEKRKQSDKMNNNHDDNEVA